MPASAPRRRRAPRRVPSARAPTSPPASARRRPGRAAGRSRSRPASRSRDHALTRRQGALYGASVQRLDLLRNLVYAELTARYKTTTLGILWFVLNPLLTMLILVVVFQRLIRLDIPHYPVFVLSALLPWTFFTMGLMHASTSITR